MKRKRLALFLIILAICTPAAFTGCRKTQQEQNEEDKELLAMLMYIQGTEDSHEQDDSINAAIGKGFFPANTWFTGTMWDSDIYMIDVPAGEQHVIVECNFTDSKGNIDLMLLLDETTYMAKSENDTDSEIIDMTLPSPGTYYIYPYKQSLYTWGIGDGQKYDIWWSHQP